MPSKITPNEVERRFAMRAPEYQVLSEYANSKTKILVRHNCGHTYKVTPGHFWEGDMCPKCNKKAQQERQQKEGRKILFSRLAELGLGLLPGQNYTNDRQKIEVKCLKCGRVQTSWGCNIYAGHGCKSCNNSRPMSREDFLKKLAIRAPEWELVGEYINAKTKTLFRHKKCGKTFERTPDWVCTSPNKCNRCSRSNGETSLVDSIIAMLPEDEEYLLNNRSVLGGKELDLYLPKLGIAVEYNGLHYHASKVLSKKGHNPINYHLQKTLDAKDKGVRVIHVFEDEWLEHPDIVKDKMRAYLKLPLERRYYARQTTVKEITPEVAGEFLNANHIQGKGGARVAIGLYYGDGLVAVQTFAKYSSGKPNEYDLTRYATKLGTQVVGGFSKCLKYFEKMVSPSKVVSFADRRWSTEGDNVYTKNGFELDGVVPPSYWYTIRQQRLHKFLFRKKLIARKFPEIYSLEKTEREMMEEAGYDRIYDCGLLRYVKKYV